MRGPVKDIEYTGGNGNYYFRAVSFYLAGNENWHKEIRATICDYIRFWPGKLRAMLKGGNGWDFIRKSNMNKSGIWATG